MDLPKKPMRGLAPKPTDDRIDLEVEFHKIGEGRGYLGDANGIAAYAYVRVSGDAQAEEGRSGLPRQLWHIHEVAQKGVPEQGIPPLRITWDMVYADEGYSGFEFRNRPALNALLNDIQVNKRSKYLLIEHIDRLSRHATWHQGYLLELIEKAGCQVVFWRAYHSAIERSVLGAIAEQGMKHEIQRMMAGQRLKARSGRVTAKRARFGYMFVNSRGEPQEKPGNDTHYAPHPELAPVIQWVYHALVYEHKTLCELVKKMNEGGVPGWDGPIPTGRGGCVWYVGTLANMVKNPVYKGEFYAARYETVRTGEYNVVGREKTRMRERERSEWIRVDVPALVTAQEWALAQKRLQDNMKRSSRNTKRRDWLLSGLLRCGRCGYTWSSMNGGTNRSPHRYYGCVSRHNPKACDMGVACMERSYIRAEVLEHAVWQALLEVIMDPEVILKTMGSEYQDRIAQHRNQLEFLTGSLQKLGDELQRWNRAYASGVIDLEELKGYRADVLRRQEAIQIEIDDLSGRIQYLEGIEDNEGFVRETLSLLRNALDGAGEQPPEDLKHQVVRMLVDTVWVNDQTMVVTIEGVVSNQINLMEIVVASQSSRRSR